MDSTSGREHQERSLFVLAVSRVDGNETVPLVEASSGGVALKCP
jgi:hypothetical protein